MEPRLRTGSGNESRQNKADMFRWPVFFNLMKLQDYIHLKKEHKLAKTNLEGKS
jgi:hypothetical protein